STVNQWTQLALLPIRALCADKFALTVYPFQFGNISVVILIQREQSTGNSGCKIGMQQRSPGP
ncbi:hypothetical protein, partial [Caballeronia sordidicola]|uniref:hypothetical protein n=1 Tax=Caballeronia sordidicola TaxID=196367 RepID=UPI001ABFE1EE